MRGFGWLKANPLQPDDVQTIRDVAEHVCDGAWLVQARTPEKCNLGVRIIDFTSHEHQQLHYDRAGILVGALKEAGYDACTEGTWGDVHPYRRRR